jgi:hypothetical protein
LASWGAAVLRTYNIAVNRNTAMKGRDEARIFVAAVGKSEKVGNPSRKIL